MLEDPNPAQEGPYYWVPCCALRRKVVRSEQDVGDNLDKSHAIHHLISVSEVERLQCLGRYRFNVVLG